MSIVEPNVLELLDKADTRYTLVVEAAKRGRQIVNGSLPLVDTKGIEEKPLRIAVEEIDRGLEVLGVDIGRCSATWLTAAFACKRGVECKCHEAALGHAHGIKSARLLLHSPERPAHRYGCKFALSIFRLVEVGGKSEAILGFKRHLTVIHLVA